MSDGLRFVDSLPLPEVRAALRRGDAFEPPLRFFAEDLLGADGSIDLVGVDSEGRVVVLLIGAAGADREGVTRALAQRAWVRPRLGDWLQLAPNLPISADAPVVAWLLCPSFSQETLTAAADLGSDVIELSILRSVRNGSEATVLVERVTAARPVLEAATVDTRRETVAAERSDNAATANRGSRFRSGLSEQDLGLTAEEIGEFD